MTDGFASNLAVTSSASCFASDCRSMEHTGLRLLKNQADAISGTADDGRDIVLTLKIFSTKSTYHYNHIAT